VAKDVRWNLVSPEVAESEYGVVVGDDGQVDQAATESKREELRSGRGEVPEFDHGPLPPLEEQRRIIAETRRKFNEWLSHELGGGNRG
jgi:N-methylhydantoinase B